MTTMTIQIHTVIHSLMRAAPIGESCHDRYDTDEETGLTTCNDGTHKADPKDCKDVTKKPLPYCDTPAGKSASSCHDRLDYDDVTGLTPCNDGIKKLIIMIVKMRLRLVKRQNR